MPYKDRKSPAAQENARVHRRRWYEDNRQHAIGRVAERKAAIRAFLAEVKAGMSCVRCGEDDPACLDFHHRDPAAKELHIGRVAGAGWSLARIKAEIEKCDVLCANCHRKLHRDECGSVGQ